VATHLSEGELGLSRIEMVGIIGSREWTGKGCIERFVELLGGDIVVISGGQVLGVDGWVREAACNSGIKYHEYPPEHARPNGHTCKRCPISGNRIRYNQKFDARHYHDRNRRIAKECDIVVAFWSGDHSRGRSSTIEACQEFDTPYVIFGNGEVDTWGLNGSKKVFMHLIQGHELEEFLPRVPTGGPKNISIA